MWLNEERTQIDSWPGNGKNQRHGIFPSNIITAKGIGLSWKLEKGIYFVEM